MKPASVSRLRLLALCLLVVPGALAMAASKFTGVYRSHGNDGGKAGVSMDVSLGRDGTATVTEDWGNGFKTLFGHWVESESRVTVSFDALEGAPAEPAMVFEAKKDGLQAVTWNRAEWGKQDPPPMTKGYKVKQLYWLTQGP